MLMEVAPPRSSVQHQDSTSARRAQPPLSAGQRLATLRNCERRGSTAMQEQTCRSAATPRTRSSGDGADLTRPLSGPDRVQGSTGESCEHKPRRKRDESTNYGATFQRPVGHRLGGRQRSDAFDVAKRLQGSARARHLETQKWVRRMLNCDAGASVRQDRGHRDSKRVSESPADCTSAVGRSQELATPAAARSRTEVDYADFLWLRINSTALIIDRPSGSNLISTVGVVWFRNEDRPELAQIIPETDIQQQTTQVKTC